MYFTTFKKLFQGHLILICSLLAVVLDLIISDLRRDIPYFNGSMITFAHVQ